MLQRKAERLPCAALFYTFLQDLSTVKTWDSDIPPSKEWESNGKLICQCMWEGK